MSVTATLFTGADTVLSNLKKLRVAAPGQFAAALYQEAQIELTEIKKRTPIQYGPLRASERLEGPTQEGGRIFVRVLAGGPAVDYAFYVHEDLEAIHPRGGEAKYIERPLNESAPYMAERIATRIRNTFKTVTVGSL